MAINLICENCEWKGSVSIVEANSDRCPGCGGRIEDMHDEY